MSNEKMKLREVNGEEICALVRENAQDDMEISFDDVTNRMEIRWEVVGREGEGIESVERREVDKHYTKLLRRLRYDHFERHGALFSVRKSTGENKYVVSQSFFVEGKGTESFGTVQDVDCGSVVSAKEQEREKFAIYKVLKAMLAMGFEGEYVFDDHNMIWEMEKPLADLNEKEALVIMERAFSLLKELGVHHWGKIYIGHEKAEGVPSIKLWVRHYAALDYDWAPIIDLVDKTNRTAEEVEEVMCMSRYGRRGAVRPLVVYGTFGRKDTRTMF